MLKLEFASRVCTLHIDLFQKGSISQQSFKMHISFERFFFN